MFGGLLEELTGLGHFGYIIFGFFLLALLGGLYLLVTVTLSKQRGGDALERIRPLREAIIAVVFLVTTISGAGFFIYKNAQQSLLSTIQTDLLAIARAAAELTDGDKHGLLVSEDQQFGELYSELTAPYYAILRGTAPIDVEAPGSVVGIYTFGRNEEGQFFGDDGQVYFVLDSGYYQEYDGVPEPNGYDFAWIREEYDEATEAMLDALRLEVAQVEPEPFFDSWGAWLTATAPFFDSKGELAGAVGVDMELSDYLAKLATIRNSLLLLVASGALVALFVGIMIYSFRNRERIAQTELRNHRDNLQQMVQEQTEEIREAFEEAKIARDVAETANNLKSEFLMNMSHELRTPIHAITNYSSVGLKSVEKGDAEKQKQHFERIHNSGERLSRLLNDLLDLSKLESGNVEYEMKSHDLAKVLQTVLGELQGLADEKKLKVKLPEKVDSKVECDKEKMHQVLLNVLSNAIKFTEENGKSIVVDAKVTGDRLTLSVADEGVGIPDGDLERVFDKFIQSERTNTGAGGTGLGLAICKEIMLGHHGNITAESNKKGGSTFVIDMPLKQPAQQAKKKAA